MCVYVLYWDLISTSITYKPHFFYNFLYICRYSHMSPATTCTFALMSNNERGDTDSDVSDLDPKELSEAITLDKYAVQLGYAEEPEEPLTADTFPSKSGGKPAWLNPEHLLNVERLTCGNCEEPLILLLQLYTPEDQPADAFHRTMYVFCCKNGNCVKQNWSKSFKVYRSQLPQNNPYYPLSLDSDEEIEDHQNVPNKKEFKSPRVCVICGILGSKACSRCGNTHYCSRQHQLSDWNMCRHKEFCGKETTGADQKIVDQLRAKRIFDEKEIVSEPEGKGEDAVEEENQASFFNENNPGEKADSKALVLAGDEAEEDTTVDVDETFLKFQMKIQLYPDQVLRYDRVEYDMLPREPLWVQDHHKPESIPNCDLCKGPRTFEFQVLSTLLNYLGVNHIASDSLDWGSLFVYSCKNNCSLQNNHYAEEYLWKQDFSSDGIRFDATDAKLMQGKNKTIL
ncbi:programmed cell death protein 2 [Pilobolus umbonatus]|nr:programmed cell death protein 2 [Pilobolus umbonatus]